VDFPYVFLVGIEVACEHWVDVSGIGWSMTFGQRIEMTELQSKILDVIAETLMIDTDDVSGDAAMGVVPEWTSFAHLSLMAAIEEAFSIELSMDEMSKATSLETLTATVHAKVG
jgi:acyl carrier protein